MANLKDLLFDVEKVNFAEKFGVPTNSDYSHAIIGNVDGNEKVLNVCSDRYELVPNADIFPAIRKVLVDNNVKFKENYKMINNARFYANFVIEGHDIQVGEGDTISPILSINHSYNGLTKYAMTFGYYRMICSNGLTIPLEGHEDKNINIVGKHTALIQTSIEALIEKVKIFFTMEQTIQKRYNVLFDRKIDNWSDRLESVIEATKQKPSKAQYEMIKNTIQNEAIQLKGGVTDWLIYNGINGYIFNNDFNKAVPEKRRELDNKVLNHMLVNA